jgi:hypothetical protein
MRRMLLIAGAASLFGIGCASSSHEMREAQEHQYKADRAAAEGDYHRAAREQDKAAAERREAVERQQLEQ